LFFFSNYILRIAIFFFENEFFLSILKQFKVIAFPILVPVIAYLANNHWHELILESLEALRSIQEQGLKHGDIQVVFSIAEEAGLSGAKHIDSSKLHAKFGFIFDLSGNLGNVAVKAPSS
jgi:hypothetical protein